MISPVAGAVDPRLQPGQRTDISVSRSFFLIPTT